MACHCLLPPASGLGPLSPESLVTRLPGPSLLLRCAQVVVPGAWERVAQLRLGVRPGDPPTRDIYVEVMGRYSNVVLVDSAAAEILACAYQVRATVSGFLSFSIHP